MALSGVRVLDLSRVFAGPVAGRILAELGAEVVKVEPPEGDVTRLWGRKAAGLSTYFTQQNLGKKNICVDLRKPGGSEIVADLAAVADVVVENFRPGVLARFGLDWPSLSARSESLVMLSISGFGQDGPESQRAAYASVIHGETGLFDLSGEVPRDITFSAGDVLSGMHGVIGLLAALRVRDQTGVGQHIDLAMMDAMAFSMDTILDSLDDRESEPKGGEIFEATGGPINIVGGLRWVWHQMSGTHDLSDGLTSDADLAEKLAARRRAITDFLRTRPDRDAVLAAVDEAGLAWGDVRKLGAVLESPTFGHRGTIMQVDDRAGGTRPIVRAPYRFSGSDAGEPAVAPFRGEHNRDVLRDWLGLDSAAIDALHTGAVLLTDEWTDTQ